MIRILMQQNHTLPPFTRPCSTRNNSIDIINSLVENHKFTDAYKLLTSITPRDILNATKNNTQNHGPN